MATMNLVVLAGNLTMDPELRETKGDSVCEMNMAVNQHYTDKNGQRTSSVDFFKVTAWGAMGENCNKYLTKGSPLLVQGRLKLQQWETKEGEKRSRVYVVAQNVQFLGTGKKQEGEGDEEPPARRAAPAKQASNEPDEDDIPF